MFAWRSFCWTGCLLTGMLAADLFAACPASSCSVVLRVNSTSCAKVRQLIKTGSCKKVLVGCSSSTSGSSWRKKSSRGHRKTWNSLLSSDFRNTFSSGSASAVRRENGDDAPIVRRPPSVFTRRNARNESAEAEKEAAPGEVMPSAEKEAAPGEVMPLAEKERTIYIAIQPEKPAVRTQNSAAEPPSAPEKLDPVTALKRIHAVQLDILKRRNQLTLKEYNAEVEKILNAAEFLEDADGNIDGIPFADRMADMNRLLSEIRYGLVKTEIAAKSKSDEQLLREIQQMQLDALAQSGDRGN